MVELWVWVVVDMLNTSVLGGLEAIVSEDGRDSEPGGEVPTSKNISSDPVSIASNDWESKADRPAKSELIGEPVSIRESSSQELYQEELVYDPSAGEPSVYTSSGPLRQRVERKKYV